MPRPLIIKIEGSTNHNYQPMKSPMNRDFPLTLSKSLQKIDIYPEKVNMAPPKSFVKNLIDMYEDQNFSKSNLVKAKSLPSILQTKPVLLESSKSALNHKEDFENNDRSDREGFDFKRVWRKFESSSSISETQSSKDVKKTEYQVIDLKYIQEKADALIYDYDHVTDSFWKKQVLAFLNDICTISSNIKEDIIENHTVEVKKKIKSEESEKFDTVKERANFFERQGSGVFMTYKPEKLSGRYFNDTDTNGNNKEDDRESLSAESTLSEDSEYSQSSYKIQHIPPTTMKIVELKSFFETKKDTTTEESEVIETYEGERILPPLEVVVDDEDEKEVRKDPRDVIIELLQQIEYYKKEIENTSKEDIDRGSEINEHLIQILIQLDDVYSRDDAIRAERKEAIAFVQKCIRMLRDKMRN